MMEEQTKMDLIRQYIIEYSDIAKKFNKHFSKNELAKIIYDKHQDLFSSKETVRLYVRRALACNGEKYRTDKFVDFAERYSFIPDPIIELEDLKSFVVPVSIKKTLWLADTHGRFYDKVALETAINHGIKNNCDSVILLGDICDFYADSKFDKDPRISAIWEDMEWVQDVLELLQDTFGYVVAKEGNHDERREKHIMRLSQTMPELVDVNTFENFCSFDGCHVNFVKGYNRIIYGKLNGLHGHELYGGGILVARNRLLKTFDNTISAHSHISQFFSVKDINNNMYGSWTLGCMCNLNPRYNPMNRWTQGFAITEKDDTGTFEVDNKMIHNGKIF